VEAQHIKFIFTYARLNDVRKAAIEEGIDDQEARQILSSVEGQTLLKCRKQELAAAAMITKESILKDWYDIKNADVNQAMQVRRVNCRYCNGVGHKYQWSNQEYAASYERAMCNPDKKKQIEPDIKGGFGFNPWALPVTSCTECGGVGEEKVFVESFDKLPASVRKAISSIEAKSDGAIKINFRDKDKATDSMAKYLGMFVDHQHITGNLGITKGAEDMTDEELLTIAAQARDNPQ
jgi:hypothetical protein